MRRTIPGFLAAVVALGACSVDTTPPGETDDALTLTSTTTSPSSPWCMEPPEPTEPPLVSPMPALPSVQGSLIERGSTVAFTPRTAERARVRISLDEYDPRGGASYVNVRVANRTIRIQKAPVTVRQSSSYVFLGSEGATLRDLELRVGYRFTTSGTKRSMTVASVSLVNPTSGVELDDFGPSPWFTDVPGSCEEKALLSFGPLPWDMPYLKFPKIEGCSDARCQKLANAWVHLHLNVWRANQMFAVLENMGDAQKSYFWNQPGTNANGDAVTVESSPAYWYGAYDQERYESIRETMGKYWNVVLEAKAIETKLRLVCPDYDDNPGNVCFNSSVRGHHWVVGWINFCDSAFTGVGCTNNAATIHEVMHHEPLHHQWTHLNGLKALRDTVTHWHGNSCLGSPKTEPLYCEDLVQHFVNEGGHCDHLDKLARTIDVHAMFTRRIGDLVFNGDMTHWPKPTDPTPKPPECVGDIGCLCPDANGEPPDGDWSIDSACDDDESQVVCMKKKFNASDTTGICTSCDDLRGPGCPCNDLTEPCEQGVCWGDDTGGNASATGTCYMEPPPSWGCLADCEALLGNGAFCMHDHPDGARCVPYNTSLPEATACWEAGGQMDPQTLSCTLLEECTPEQTCQDLGYPVYFTCDYNQRCVPNP